MQRGTGTVRTRTLLPWLVQTCKLRSDHCRHFARHPLEQMRTCLRAHWCRGGPFFAFLHCFTQLQCASGRSPRESESHTRRAVPHAIIFAQWHDRIGAVRPIAGSRYFQSGALCSIVDGLVGVVCVASSMATTCRLPG